MITAIDTSVLVDVFQNDPEFGHRSAVVLRQCLQEGKLVACDVVWAEVSGVFPSMDEFNRVMENIPVEFLPMERTSAALAGRMWRAFRSKGGNRKRVVADFLIAAHAQVQCDRILTRDRGFLREHFQELKVIDPSVAR